MSSGIEEAHWYIARNGEHRGPFQFSQIEQFYEDGHLLASDHLWSDGMAAWQPVTELLAGPAAVPRPPPPPPPAEPFRRDRAWHVGDGTGRPAADGGRHHLSDYDEERGRHAVTTTTIEGGSFKLSTFIFLLLGLFVPLWPISLPLFWFLAYRSYKKPSTQIVHVHRH